MMKTFLINQEGDLEFDGQNNLRMVSGEGEKAQSLRLRLSTNQGEWFLNTGFGLDYSVIQTKDPDLEEVRAVILEALEQEERVEEVLSLEANLADRVLAVTFLVRMAGEDVEGQVVM